MKSREKQKHRYLNLQPTIYSPKPTTHQSCINSLKLLYLFSVNQEFEFISYISPLPSATRHGRNVLAYPLRLNTAFGTRNLYAKLQALTFNMSGWHEDILFENDRLRMNKCSYVIGQPLAKRVSVSNAQGIHILGVKFTPLGLSLLTSI